MRVSSCRHKITHITLIRWIRHPNPKKVELVFTVTILCEKCGREFHGEVS